MSARTTSIGFADRGFATSEFFARDRRTRLDATLRNRGPLVIRNEAPRLDLLLESASSIQVASVSWVQRTLAGKVVLDPVEMACAQTYRRDSDRERFLASRMLLRHALSEAAAGKVAPEAWSFREGAFGKPRIAPGLPRLEFNVSHSGDYIAVAISKKDPIGVDIECLDPDVRTGIVHDVLTEAEQQRLARLPSDQQWTNFIRIWTTKEACAKALGLGVSLDFQRMEVHTDPLRVRLLDRSSSGTDFDVATTTIARNGRSYSLSVARVLTSAIQV